jgi:Cft2 family RNA processing exonuclease
MDAPGLLRLRFLGGARSIGASCALIEMDGARLVVDCGVRMQGSLADRLPDLSPLEDGGGPSAVLVTHAHLDHIGALPVLAGRFPAAPVYATPPTIALMKILLLDALKIMESESEGEVPLYSRPAVDALLARTIPVKPYVPFEPAPGGPRATFFLAGHILGACAVGLEGPSGRILFTGDLSTGSQRTIPRMSPPRFRPHLVVAESTYGARLHPPRGSEEERLVTMIGETIAARGKVLVPAFAIGRAQEVILTLIQAMLTRKLPPFPVHVDGLVRNVCGVYRDHAPYLQPALKRRIERIGDPFFDILENVRPVAGEKRRLEILDGPPCAIVSSSGMLAGGASPIYARVLAEGPENLIAITGYQDEESPGRRLLDAADGQGRSIVLEGREVVARCRVARYSLSAHADGNGIAGLLRVLGPSDTLLVHGDDEARSELAGLLVRERLGRVHQPREDRDYSFVLGGSGGAGDRLRSTGIGRGPLDGAVLRDHLLATYGPGASFTLDELHRIWHGETISPLAAEPFEAAVRSSPSLEEDPRKPFRFGARIEEARPAGGPAEPNVVLDRVDAALGDGSGLLKKSYSPGIPHLVLHFDFPDRVAGRSGPAIDGALSGTGWTWSIHPSPNLAALDALILGEAPDRDLIARAPSVRVEERSATIWLARGLADGEREAWEEAGREIEEASGFRISFSERPGTPAARRDRDAEGRLEVNLAYKRIREAFEKERHRPARIGVHPGRERPVIRLSFISPEVGERYRDLLATLEADTGWPLQVAPAADQNGIIEEARRVLDGIVRIRKGPRFLGRDRTVSVELESSPPDPEALRREFRERTGYELRLLI